MGIHRKPVETGFYYLQTRYYDPDIGAFISADTVNYLDPKTIGGLNLYTFCYNNPIMYVDPNGHIAFFLITMLIGLAIGTGVALYNDYKDDNSINGSIGVGGYVMPILIGGAVGAFAGMAISGALTGSFFTGVKGVLTGAKMVYGMYKAVGIAGAGYMMLDNLSNAMYYTPHTFWSGGDVAKDSAMEYSMMNGATTLEMTRLGNYLASLKTYNEAAWRIASVNFVNQVPEYSTVHAILYYPDMRTNAIWLTEELVELAKKFIEIVIGK